MTENAPVHNERYEHILDAAEALFAKRGYASVTLRDIAAEVDMRHASLYYYAPGGKEALFVAVMERNFRRHHDGLTEVLSETGTDAQATVYAVIDWMASQPPLDMTRMIQADMPAIDPAHRERLMNQAYDALRVPIGAALRRLDEAGAISVVDYDLAAMVLVTLAQGLHIIPPEYADGDRRRQIGYEIGDMLLNGWKGR